jgi:hypothetical protein
MDVLQVFQIPLRDPVIVIALAMLVFLVAPVLFERLRLPTTVAFIAAGAVLGPHGSLLGLITAADRKGTPFLAPRSIAVLGSTLCVCDSDADTVYRFQLSADLASARRSAEAAIR